MTDEIVVVGAGGFGREALDVIEAAVSGGADYRILGVVDANPRPVDLARLTERHISYLGREDEWIRGADRGTRFIVAIGDPRVREAVTMRMSGAGFRPITVIHPRAVIGSMVSLEDGVVICSGVQISTNVSVGAHVHLNPGCIVGHDAVLEPFVSVNPGAVISGNVLVRSRTLVGAGSTVLQGLTIGADSTVGAAACVTADVEAGTVVKGIPARK